MPNITIKSSLLMISLCLLLNACSDSSEQTKLQKEISETRKAVASEHQGQAKAEFALPKPVIFGSDAQKPTASAPINKSGNPLENYPLKSLRFVGTLSQDNQTWAYIMTPDNMLYQVRPGEILGSESGRVLKVETDHIEVSMQERTASNEKSEKIISLQLKE